MSKRPLTPCIGICSTALGDEVCRGCKRFAEEVIRWNGYTNQERFAVLNRLDNLLVQSMQIIFTIENETRLKEQIQFQQIDCNFDKDPYCWLYDLLRQGAGQIKNLNDFGANLNKDWIGSSLLELKEKVDNDYFDRSENYFKRYILPGKKALEKNSHTLEKDTVIL